MSVVVKPGYGEGGVGISTSDAKHPKLYSILAAVAADISAAKGAEVTQADAPAQTAGYVQADVQAIADLANALKAAWNAAQGSSATFVVE